MRVENFPWIEHAVKAKKKSSYKNLSFRQNSPSDIIIEM